MKVQKGLNPALIIIDYADIMRSTRKFDSLRHELKLVYEELRGLATEMDICAWTASQSNRDGANSEMIDMTNMSEAYGKAFVADFLVSISRKSHEKATGQGRIYVAKNRAGKDGLLFPLMIDTARSKFTITSGSMDFDQAKGNTGDFKTDLSRRVSELRADGLIK